MTDLLEPGKYVVAVSGGVDSVVLLHMLASDPKLELVVAHFDHGIRPDSALDAVFVGHLTKKLNVNYVSERMELGKSASEAIARKFRYDFLYKILGDTNATAIVTAHHQDDLIETALLNVLRGTKRRGFVSLQSTDLIRRPLLQMTKAGLQQYAEANKLQWREDASNLEDPYRRNKIRHIIKNSLTPGIRRKVIGHLNQIQQQNQAIEEAAQAYLAHQPDKVLYKVQLNKLYLAEAYEITAAWFRRQQVTFDTETIKRLVVGARTLQNGSQIDIQHNHYAELTKEQIILKQR